MNYMLFGIAAYLMVGAYLTHSRLAGMQKRRSLLRDWALGSALLPVVFLLGLLFILFEKLWARLLIVLDLDPTEDMRAGPAEPATRKSGSNDTL